MSQEFKMEIITPERVVFSDNVTSVLVTSIEGRLEILYDHRPLITKLELSPLTFKQKDKTNIVSITGQGYLDVAPEKVMILCDTAELAEEIDKERAEEAKKRAEERLNSKDDKIDAARADAALNRALTRIRTVDKLSK